MEVTVDGDTAAQAHFGLARRLIAALPNAEAVVNQPVNLTIPLTSDAAGHKLAHTLGPDAPEGARLDPATGVFTWTPTVRYAGRSVLVSVRIHDLFDPNFSETASFTIKVAGSATEVDYVSALYATLLGRTADTAGLEHWIGLLQRGATRQQIVKGIWNSREHRGLQVDRLVATYLHGAADARARAHWVRVLMSGVSETEMAFRLLTSAAYQRAHPTTRSYLVGLYADVLGRAPNPGGLERWQAAAGRGLSRAQIAPAFLGSNEAQRRLVQSYYTNYLGRAGTAAEVALWLTKLRRDRVSAAGVAQALLASSEFFARAVR
jgi:hypothetical protein